jgi:hypothetical protein
LNDIGFFETKPLSQGAIIAPMTIRPAPQLPAVHQQRFTFADLLAQAKADLWSKEVQTGYTVTYTWMANQLGHFALGFIPVFIFLWTWLASGLFPGLPLPAIIPAAWLLWFVHKEYGDVRAAIQDAAAGNVFPFDKRDVVLDAATAVYFFAAGLAVAAADLAAPWQNNPLWYWLPVALFALLFAIGLWPAGYWLTRKRCFQQADLPYIFRLANFPRKIAAPAIDAAVPAILSFVAMQGPWKHLLICGGPLSGKTDLGAGIGTEHTFQLGSARYFDLYDFLQVADLPVDPASAPTRPLWPWQNSNIVILDDVDVFEDEASQRLEILNRPHVIAKLKSLKSLPLLQQRQTVWLVGNPAKAQFWADALCDLLNIQTAELGVLFLAPGKPAAQQSMAVGAS